MSLNSQILIGALTGVALGLVLGIDLLSGVSNTVIYLADLLGSVFINMLKMVMMPLVFTSITVGIANLSVGNQIHKVWMSTLMYSLSTMSLSVLVGITASNLFEPGKGIDIKMFHDALGNVQNPNVNFAEFVAKFVSSLFMNPIAAMSQGHVMGIIVFAILVGVALVVGGQRYRATLSLFQEFFDLSLLILDWIMRLAPFGIAALLTKLIATQNIDVLTSLIGFVSIIMGTLVFHGLIVLPLVLYLVTQMTPWTLFRGAKEALITALATSSSAATMPVTMRCTEQNLKVSPSVTGFVIPLGSHLNMDGTALYEAAAALFVANLTGIELSILQQLTVCLTAMVAAIGAPGLPSAGMVTMIMVLQSVGLPVEAIAILLPVDRILALHIVNIVALLLGIPTTTRTAS
ncbi:MAG: dicarboxylate/amino acid:cation symporter [Methylococcaceae bacterium]|nr:dicarboxylate/amino acid:cation symporter [Methylococcaceae bacterium]